MELRAERDALLKERAGLADLLADDARQWKRIGEELARLQASSANPPPAARRTEFAEAGEVEEVDMRR
jgi:topoisomerase-4 subunit A